MKRSRIYVAIFFVIAAIAFFLKSNIYLDPDLGWQIKTGEYILKHGFPYTDPFSYTMPHFRVVAHSWLSDILFYTTIQKCGMLCLSMLVSISLAAILVVIFGISWHTWTFIPALLLCAHILPYVGIRPQTFSWLLFAILVRVLTDSVLNKKYKKFLPYVFLFWAQVHGGFFIGLVILGIYTAYSYAKTKGIQDVLLLMYSAALTIINPYGLALWREVFSTFLSLTLHSSVNEWTPIISRLDLRLGIVFLLPLALLFRYWKRFPSFLLQSYFILSIAMLSASKLFPFWLIVAVYIINKGFGYLGQDVASIPGAPKRYGVLLYVISLVVITNSIILAVATVRTYENLSEEKYYPVKAVKYIQNNPPQGNIFAPFGWGGYLIWKLPEKKVFIDGRMAYWENVLDEYIKIVTLQSPFEKYASSYNIRMVLVQKSKTSFVNLASHLKEIGWEKAYEDDTTLLLIYK